MENEFFRHTISSKHLPLIKNTFNYITKQDCDVSIVVQGTIPQNEENIQFNHSY